MPIFNRLPFFVLLRCAAHDYHALAVFSPARKEG
jgi:hypothetical protein